MKGFIKINTLLLFTISAVNTPNTTFAQNLPKVQEESIQAPSNIKIDGKTTEWGDSFQAYNTNNRIYYTISNDDNNLYLTLLTSDGYANEKVKFGISFTASLSAAKNNETNAVVTFPIPIPSEKSNPLGANIRMAWRLKNDTTNLALAKIDSLRSSLNAMMNDAFKEINVNGIKEIQEPTISIYNLEGIKVAAQFNEEMQYTYELAIPLKYLSNYINDGHKFTYNIKLNGLYGQKPYGNQLPPPVLIGNPMEVMDIDNRYVNYPTDFSGEYTLLKEQ